MISSPAKLVFSIIQLLGYTRILFCAMICPGIELAARLLAAESQLAECKRRIIQKQAPKPKFTNSFRLLWVVLSKVWGAGRIRDTLILPGFDVPCEDTIHTLKGLSVRYVESYWITLLCLAKTISGGY